MVTVDIHLLMSSLPRVGVSLAGARQFSQGQPIADAADRHQLAKILSELLKTVTVL
jgi:hypothetical protein